MSQCDKSSTRLVYDSVRNHTTLKGIDGASPSYVVQHIGPCAADGAPQAFRMQSTCETLNTL